jgi:hypothetical protein
MSPASQHFGRGADLTRYIIDHYWTVDAFLFRPTAATAPLPPEVQDKYAREYCKFFKRTLSAQLRPIFYSSRVVQRREWQGCR